jgi:hypothetical protein
MSDFNTCSGGDPVACASALVEFYRVVEETNTPPTEDFKTGDVGFARGGEEVYTVKTIGGPGGEVVLHIFDSEGEHIGWVDTGWLN